VRIVNVSDKPFEFQFNSCTYGPYDPGRIVDLPTEVAVHGIKRSIIVDDVGNVIGQRMSTLDEAKRDTKMSEMLTLECPFVQTEQCQAKPFKSVEELRVHLNTHFAAEAMDDGLGPLPAGNPKAK
jgi:hypothetical protein